MTNEEWEKKRKQAKREDFWNDQGAVIAVFGGLFILALIISLFHH